MNREVEDGYLWSVGEMAANTDTRRVMIINKVAGSGEATHTTNLD